MVEKDKSVVLDADALWWLKEKRALVIMVSMYAKSGNSVVLTPNVIEFTRLWETYFANEKEQPATLEQELALSERVGDSFGSISIDDPVVHPIAHMSQSFFGNAVIVRKGIVDIITDGNEAFYVNTIGSSKRCGGIGDVLAGTIGSFI
jgi:ATP-dependent NAD(P)H-hydrate dehydratase